MLSATKLTTYTAKLQAPYTLGELESAVRTLLANPEITRNSLFRVTTRGGQDLDVLNLIAEAALEVLDLAGPAPVSPVAKNRPAGGERIPPTDLRPSQEA